MPGGRPGRAVPFLRSDTTLASRDRRNAACRISPLPQAALNTGHQSTGLPGHQCRAAAGTATRHMVTLTGPHSWQVPRHVERDRVRYLASRTGAAELCLLAI